MKSSAKILFQSAAFYSVLAVSNFSAFSAGTQATPVKPPSVTVTTVERRQLSEILSLNGSVTPVEEVSAGADVAGLIVTGLAADVGDVVKSGQVLARLDTASLQTQLAQIVAQEAQTAAAAAQAEAQILDAEIGVKQAKDQFDRAVSLAKSGVASTATRDNAVNAYDSAKAKLNTASQGLVAARAQGGLVAAQKKQIEVQISKAEVKAPADGLILARNAQLGAVVSGAAGPLFRIAKDGAYEVVANVSETALLKLAPDMKAVLRLSGVADAISGKVRRVDPEINAASRLGKVRVWVKADPRVRPGAFAEVEIITAEREALSVAGSALIYSGKESFLQIVKDGVVETRPVKIGIRTGKLVEIAEGAALGDEVIERAGTFIADGDHVTPVKSAEATGAVK
jgi:HlyD family secretion protein